jgi:hypothetical protein
MRTLITGSPDRVAALAALFERSGDDLVTLDQLGPGGQALDRYVQLGVTVPVRGETVVQRIHSFLSDGLLERFAAVERILPWLADEATVLLVAGNQPAEVAAPDDRAARLSLLRVLAHGIRADQAPKRVRVRVISGERSDQDIVDFAHSGDKDARAEMMAPPDEPATSVSYQDWRTEVLGLAQVEV